MNNEHLSRTRLRRHLIPSLLFALIFSPIGLLAQNPGATNRPPRTPVNVAPTNGAMLSLSAALKSSDFVDDDAADTHAATEWVVKAKLDGKVVLLKETAASNRYQLSANTNLQANTAYQWQVRYKDSRGAWSDYSSATTFTAITNAPPKAPSGLRIAMN